MLCKECFSLLNAKFINYQIGAIHALAVYDYDDHIKNLIYKFKGCYDYELKDVFLFRYINYLKIRYKDYVIVPVPSSKFDDEKRGFNHVVEIYKCLGFKMYEVIKKISKEKQSSKTSKERLKVDKMLVSQNIEQIRDKKVLIVDDIYTTGSTIARTIELVKKGKPKDIKVLVIAKTIDLEKRKKA